MSSLLFLLWCKDLARTPAVEMLFVSFFFFSDSSFFSPSLDLVFQLPLLQVEFESWWIIFPLFCSSSQKLRIGTRHPDSPRMPNVLFGIQNWCYELTPLISPRFYLFPDLKAHPCQKVTRFFHWLRRSPQLKGLNGNDRFPPFFPTLRNKRPLPPFAFVVSRSSMIGPTLFVSLFHTSFFEK